MHIIQRTTRSFLRSIKTSCVFKLTPHVPHYDGGAWGHFAHPSAVNGAVRRYGKIEEAKDRGREDKIKNGGIKKEAGTREIDKKNKVR